MGVQAGGGARPVLGFLEEDSERLAQARGGGRSLCQGSERRSDEFVLRSSLVLRGEGSDLELL